jgi:methylated-DNA-[protein]-cysteine S-methyltransferase
MELRSPYQAGLPVPFGMLGIYCTDEVLTGITFLSANSKMQTASNLFAKEICRQLNAFFLERDFEFDLPLKLNGTEHQLKVWQALREIPGGEVRTYGTLAKLLHSSPRAVGQACGNNPIPIVIPCHRIVGKSGLGGFMHSSESKELNIKHWLLAHEQR